MSHAEHIFVASRKKARIVGFVYVEIPVEFWMFHEHMRVSHCIRFQVPRVQQNLKECTVRMLIFSEIHVKVPGFQELFKQISLEVEVGPLQKLEQEAAGHSHGYPIYLACLENLSHILVSKEILDSLFQDGLHFAFQWIQEPQKLSGLGIPFIKDIMSRLPQHFGPIVFSHFFSQVRSGFVFSPKKSIREFLLIFFSLSWLPFFSLVIAAVLEFCFFCFLFLFVFFGCYWSI